jgi:hypothetical protein
VSETNAETRIPAHRGLFVPLRSLPGRIVKAGRNAGVAQRQSASVPGSRRGFDSRFPPQRERPPRRRKSSPSSIEGMHGPRKSESPVRIRGWAPGKDETMRRGEKVSRPPVKRKVGGSIPPAAATRGDGETGSCDLRTVEFRVRIPVAPPGTSRRAGGAPMRDGPIFQRQGYRPFKPVSGVRVPVGLPR